MFDTQDMPLFSGTPIKANESRFSAKPVEKQMILGSCPVCLDTGVIVDGERNTAHAIAVSRPNDAGLFWMIAGA